MLIETSNLALTSEHRLQTSTSRAVKLLPGEAEGAPESFGKLFERELQAVPAQLLRIEAAPAEPPAAKDDYNPFQTILEMLFGLPAAAEAAPALADGETAPGQHSFGGLRLMQMTHTSETESCSFAASGNICLADGSTRQFDVGYRMDRSEESTRIDVGIFKDPLAVDFGEPRNVLGSVDFDIDSDGTAEKLRLPAGNSAVLFRDLNHNGRADDGSELFGPQTGDGFAELAKLDADGNAWIDEGDAAFADLMLWQIAADGSDSVQSLAEAGIGALATASAATPFTLKEDGEAVGQVRASSVWLGEHSGAGIVRQIDVGVAPADERREQT